MNTDELIQRAMSHRQAGEFADAAEAFSSAFALAPTDWRLINEAGVCLLCAGRFAEAAGLFERALPLAPDRAFVLFNVGLARVQAGELDAAERAFQEILAERSNPRAWVELGLVHMKRQGWDEALRCLDRALVDDVVLNGFNMTGSPGLDREVAARVYLNKARIFGFELGQADAARQQLALLFDELGDRGRVFTFANEARARDLLPLACAAASLLLADYEAHEPVRELCDALGLQP
jgi:tetratricopeptide (TPR) repeat protein